MFAPHPQRPTDSLSRELHQQAPYRLQCSSQGADCILRAAEALPISAPAAGINAPIHSIGVAARRGTVRPYSLCHIQANLAGP